MAMLAQHLAGESQQWTKDTGGSFTADGEIELHALIGASQLRATHRPSFAGGAVTQGSADLDEVQRNFRQILNKAASLAGGKPIDAVTLQKARLSLRPIFPFC